MASIHAAISAYSAGGKNFQGTTETSPPSYNPKFELPRAFTLIHPSTGGKHMPLVFKES